MNCKRHSPDQAAALFQRSIDLLDDFKLDEALDLLLHLLNYHIDAIEEWNLHEFIGLCYHYKKMDDKAVDHLEKAYRGAIKGSDNELNILIILTNLAGSYSELGESDKALKYFKKADLNIHLYEKEDRLSDLYLYYLSKGRCLLFLERYEDARKEYLKSLDLTTRTDAASDPVVSENIIHYELARAYYGMTLWHETYAQLRKVDMNTLPSTHHSNFRYIDTVTKVNLEKYDEGVRAFEEYREYGIDDFYGPRAYYFAGKAYFFLRRYPEARSNFQEALSYPKVPDWVEEGCENYMSKIDNIN